MPCSDRFPLKPTGEHGNTGKSVGNADGSHIFTAAGVVFAPPAAVGRKRTETKPHLLELAHHALVLGSGVPVQQRQLQVPARLPGNARAGRGICCWKPKARLGDVHALGTKPPKKENPSKLRQLETSNEGQPASTNQVRILRIAFSTLKGWLGSYNPRWLPKESSAIGSTNSCKPG